MRELLKELGLEKEVIDSIMAEYGKNIQSYKDQVEDYKSKINTLEDKNKEYETKVQELTETTQDNTKLQEELNALKTSIAEKDAMEKKKKDDELLTNNIIALFGDKQFTSDYAKNGLIADIKKELENDETHAKGIKDIYEELTANRTDIFVNPNQVQDMAGMQDMDSGVSKEDFDKMSYKQRLDFKESNPELFNKYNN